MAAPPFQYTASTESTPLDAVIIGAGPAGVVSLRNLLRAQLNAIAIERQPGVGGLWLNHTPDYSSLQVLRKDWGIHGVECGSDDADQRRFLRKHVLQWVEQYVAHFNLMDRILLNREVVTIKFIRPMLFLVEISEVEKCGYLGGGRRIEETTMRIYARSVLFCAGTS
jgi:cation diffusion facilitator CzcD-associated flavoprotein CzcO